MGKKPIPKGYKKQQAGPLTVAPFFFGNCRTFMRGTPKTILSSSGWSISEHGKNSQAANHFRYPLNDRRHGNYWPQI
jgi:hypothetical protein